MTVCFVSCASWSATLVLTDCRTEDSGTSRAPQIAARSSLDASFWPRSTSDRYPRETCAWEETSRRVLFLLAAFHLRQIPEGNPRLGRDLAQSPALAETFATQFIPNYAAKNDHASPPVPTTAKGTLCAAYVPH